MTGKVKLMFEALKEQVKCPDQKILVVWADWFPAAVYEALRITPGCKAPDANTLTFPNGTVVTFSQKKFKGEISSNWMWEQPCE
jgi:hypothetical protein